MQSKLALRGRKFNNFIELWCLMASGDLDICVSSTSFQKMLGSFHFMFLFLVTLTKKRTNQLSFSGKIRIFYKENKQTGQLIFFVFGHFDQKTKNGMNRTLNAKSNIFYLF